ncbi:hypothetical protein GA0070609_4435 [Micromonospora echinaurantiaca]|uniref:Uncharacterized protein n=1 Tax=Micromonospora echinaurantiaca TaxID=47857 RepID=A0A1C5JHJ5_9ACTN|nr:hypothetical protein [Micromonospora echinaurantiaca]SCG69679.1 hypothetical protein GA0070609_4435 [Micromonospora echinaurantiaca]
MTVEPFRHIYHRCPVCRERLHEYLFRYVDRITGERDLTACLPCKSGRPTTTRR